jgi:hypothetical protein
MFLTSSQYSYHIIITYLTTFIVLIRMMMKVNSVYSTVCVRLYSTVVFLRHEKKLSERDFRTFRTDYSQ